MPRFLAPLVGALLCLFACTALRAENIRFPAGARLLDVTAAPYNAPTDGITDATAAIQAALNAAGTAEATSVRTLYFPNGTYLVSATLSFPGDGGTDLGVLTDNHWYQLKADITKKATAGQFTLVLSLYHWGADGATGGTQVGSSFTLDGTGAVAGLTTLWNDPEPTSVSAPPTPAAKACAPWTTSRSIPKAPSPTATPPRSTPPTLGVSCACASPLPDRPRPHSSRRR